jgi:hypothetical protein
MTPREQAVALYERYYKSTVLIDVHRQALECAIICAQQMLNEYEERPFSARNTEGRIFWEAVKQELLEYDNDDYKKHGKQTAINW